MTNASTTGLLNVRTHEWSQTILDLLHIPESLLPSIEPPGTIRGKTAAGVFVTSVASHDTASAVVAIPATTSHFAYVIVGTWSLVGIELASPVLTESARVANFTNELGVDNRVRFLRNVGGLWLLQECLREWPACNYDELLAKASELPVGGPTIEVRDPDFIAPGRMAARVKEAAGQSDMTPDEITRCIIDSLALAFADTIRQAVGLSGASVEVVHMVGGGSQNVLLCQQTANAVGIPVIAGPVEATALGNVLIQARSHGAAPSSLEDLREIVASSTELRRFEPQ
jgi:rhamnulokinase